MLETPSLASTLSVDAILAGIAEGFFALGSDWRFIAFNPAAEAIFQTPSREILGKLLWEVSPNIRGTEFERRYRLVMSERTKQTFEAYSALRPDHYHEVRAFPLGEGIGVSFRDVSHRRHAAQALQDRESELARIQRIGGVGGMDIDLRGGFASHRSPEYLKIHGLPPDAANEMHDDWVNRLHPEDRRRAERHFLDAIEGRDTHYQSEYRIVRQSDG
jgi:PAS domain-containing protein